MQIIEKGNDKHAFPFHTLDWINKPRHQKKKKKKVFLVKMIIEICLIPHFGSRDFLRFEIDRSGLWNCSYIETHNMFKIPPTSASLFHISRSPITQILCW